MKKKAEVKYEAQIAKSTIPKEYELYSWMSVDEWYPVSHLRENSFEIPSPSIGNLFCFKKRCIHIGGGNWKIRKVKTDV